MRLPTLAAALTAFVLVACGDGSNDNPGGDTKTLQLQARDDGSLNYCDDNGNCTGLPNPGGCQTLDITIDMATGKACQTCVAADGTASDEDCRTPAVACDVVTIPDPDCVVCAYVNGTVIFSSCVPTSPPLCYTTDDNGSTSSSGPDVPPSSGNAESPGYDSAGNVIAPPPGCTVCVDGNGKRISQDCPPSCELVDCPMIKCAPGYQTVTSPGDCCGHCEPVRNCTDIACTEMVPYCPDGQFLVRDPTQCCGWYCEPRHCDANLACPAIAIDCAPGYEVSYAAPHCCGACVPSYCDDADFCAQE